MTFHIYEGHLGGLYWTEEYFEPKRCDTCGDSDWYLGAVLNREQLRALLFKSSWDEEYVNEFEDEIPWGDENGLSKSL